MRFCAPLTVSVCVTVLYGSLDGATHVTRTRSSRSSVQSNLTYVDTVREGKKKSARELKLFLISFCTP